MMIMVQSMFMRMLAVVIALYTFSLNAFAQHQIFHASPDPVLDSLIFWDNTPGIGGRISRIYPAGSNTYTSLKYQNATPLVLPYTSLSFSIANTLTTTPTVTFASYQVSFPPRQNAVMVMGGVVSTSGYAPNPDGRSVILRPFVTPITNATFDANGFHTGPPIFAFFHGCTDAPALDIYVRGIGIVASNLKYGDFSPYFPLPRANYILDLRQAGTSTTVASFSASFLSGFLMRVGNRDSIPFPVGVIQGTPHTAIISGFLNPQNNRGSVTNRTPPPIEIFLSYSYPLYYTEFSPNNPERIIPVPGNAVGKLTPLPIATSVLVQEQQSQISGLEIQGARFASDTKQCIVEITMPASGVVRTWISDIRGGKVLEEQQNYYAEGMHTLFLNVSTLTAGAYFVIVESKYGTRAEKFYVFR